MPGFSSRKRVEENEEVEEVGEKPSGQKNQIFMDFDMLSRKKVYFCRRLRHKKELYALVPLHRNLENFKAKNHNKGQDDKARANRREHIVPYCGGFPEPDAGGAMTLAPFFLPRNKRSNG